MRIKAITRIAIIIMLAAVFVPAAGYAGGDDYAVTYRCTSADGSEDYGSLLYIQEPKDPGKVSEGTDVGFIIKASREYEFIDVKVMDGEEDVSSFVGLKEIEPLVPYPEGQPNPTVFEFTMPAKDVTIIAAFRPVSTSEFCTISVEAADSMISDVMCVGKDLTPWGKSVTGIVANGSDATIKARLLDSLKDEYEFQYWKEGDEVVSTDESYNIPSVRTDRSFKAYYKKIDTIPKVSVIITADTGGVVKYKKSTDTEYSIVESGSSITIKAAVDDTYDFKAVPSNGYDFKEWGSNTSKIQGKTESIFSYKISSALMVKALFEAKKDLKDLIKIDRVEGKNKTYDGTTDAEFNPDTIQVSGIKDGDDVTITPVGNFENPNAGTDKKINIVDYTLNGEDADKYTVDMATSVSETAASITKKPASISVNKNTFEYDGKKHLPEIIIGQLAEGDECEIIYRDDDAKTDANNAGQNYLVLLEEGNDRLTNKNYMISADTYIWFEIIPRAITIKADNKDCSFDPGKDELTWTMIDKDKNWFESEEPAIDLEVIGDSGVVSPSKIENGHRYKIIPFWGRGSNKYSKNYNAQFVEGILDYAHTVNIVEEKEAGCEESGNKAYWKCASCSKMFSSRDCKTEVTEDEIMIPPTGHNWGEWVNPDEEKHERTCKNDASHKETGKHVFNEGKVTKPATSTSEEVKTYTCGTCSYEKNESVPKINDDPAPPTPGPDPDPQPEPDPEPDTDPDPRPNILEDDTPSEPMMIKVKAKAGKNRVTFSWKKVQGATQYTIYIAPKGKKYKKAAVLDAGKTSFTKKGLKKNTVYKFKFVVQKADANDKMKTLGTATGKVRTKKR